MITYSVNELGVHRGITLLHRDYIAVGDYRPGRRTRHPVSHVPIARSDFPRLPLVLEECGIRSVYGERRWFITGDIDPHDRRALVLVEVDGGYRKTVYQWGSELPLGITRVTSGWKLIRNSGYNSDIHVGLFIISPRKELRLQGQNTLGPDPLPEMVIAWDGVNLTLREE